MNYKKLKRFQLEMGYSRMQSMIDSGIVWQMEGTIGREAMSLLNSGACMLPKESKLDYYGNKIPSRYEVKKGTTGSYQNSVKYYSDPATILNW